MAAEKGDFRAASQHNGKEPEVSPEQKAKWEEQQLLLLQTEYRMLRAQVNPHFFFNTLSTIQALIPSDPDKAVTLIKNLASFFRKTLNPDQEIVTLKEELETVRNYIQIEKVRFGDRINLVEALPAELLACKMPVFSLQILVENAIHHGLSLKKGNGRIRVSGWIEGDSWYLNVEDDGVGMSETRLEEVRQGEAVRSARGTGIGLFNVRRRVQTLYGDEYGLKIQSEWHKGTSVTVRFPLIPRKCREERGGERGGHEET
ncbi:Two component system, signal transduction histidine kinase [Acididesulfobacillus acetoxydans]|uniref:histidine kinase n=1 Tax=Acididesulfobacillus acetoxydans TaxID=1561005 RepID=A0A8S0WNQ8_9FIRM|nr:histidine kinase [Acididesulfobacillus acetoxydans]CAA7601444.1 Two component system, signal transduction histidine kinase [Acididesulfobacillus acetoxydans]CEJ08875.1 Signal transduction histidine kinase, LytS [Acididesulfobacillus acetoxydans]